MNFKTTFSLAVLLGAVAARSADASVISELRAMAPADAVVEPAHVTGAAVVAVKQTVELPVVRYESFGRYRTVDGASYDAEGRAGSLRRHGYLVVDIRFHAKRCDGQPCYAYELAFRPRGTGERLPRIVRHTSPADFGSVEAASYALERRKGVLRDEGFVVLDDGVMNNWCFGGSCHSFRIDMVPAL